MRPVGGQLAPRVSPVFARGPSWSICAKRLSVRSVRGTRLSRRSRGRRADTFTRSRRATARDPAHFAPMRRTVRERPGERSDTAVLPRRTASPADQVLDLQRSAGNASVTAMLSRQTAAAPAALPTAEELTSRISNCIGVWETNRGGDAPNPQESSLDTVAGREGEHGDDRAGDDAVRARRAAAPRVAAQPGRATAHARGDRRGDRARAGRADAPHGHQHRRQRGHDPGRLHPRPAGPDHPDGPHRRERAHDVQRRRAQADDRHQARRAEQDQDAAAGGGGDPVRRTGSGSGPARCPPTSARRATGARTAPRGSGSRSTPCRATSARA